MSKVRIASTDAAGKTVVVDAPADHHLYQREAIGLQASRKHLLADGEDTVDLTLQLQDGAGKAISRKEDLVLQVGSERYRLQLNGKGKGQVEIRATVPGSIEVSVLEPAGESITLLAEAPFVEPTPEPELPLHKGPIVFEGVSSEANIPMMGPMGF